MVNPPEVVKLAMESVCTVSGHKIESWRTVQNIIRRDDFIQRIVNFDTATQMTKPFRDLMNKEYLSRPNFNFKPANISRPAGEETETETDAEPSAFPFPHSPGASPLAAQSSFPIVDPDHSTPLPNSSNPHANIYIETLSLPKSQPAALYGSILVRNLAFEKQAALRCHLARQCSI